MLRQIEVSISNGKLTPQACNEAGINVQTYYRWRKEYGGLKLEQATADLSSLGLAVFPNAGAKAGIGKLGTHSLRHSYRSWLTRLELQ